MPALPTRANTQALLLAGGRGSRMGGQDKGLIPWLDGRPLAEHVMERLLTQTDSLLINANRHQERYAEYGHAVFGDLNQRSGSASDDYQGPLAGLLAGLSHSRKDWLLVAPCDAPALPLDLFTRLAEASPDPEQTRYAQDGKRGQPLFALIPQTAKPSLDQALNSGRRAVMRWVEQNQALAVSFADQPEAFANVNDPDDLKPY